MKKLNKTMKTKGILLLILTLLTSILAGCGKAKADTSDGSSKDKIYSIGIIQSMEHAALDEAYKGFVAALADNGYNDGKEIKLDMQNAQGDTSNLSTISDRLVSDKKDLILAITTPAAQAIATKTQDIPILATAVTSYEEAGLVKSETEPGGNISGTSDMNPVAAQIDLLADMYPEAKTIGLIYNSSEDNSVLQIKLAKEAVEAKGLKYVEATVTNTNEVQQAMQSLVSKCDGIYIPTDNTLAASMPTVRGVASEAKIPTMCGTSTMVEDGGLVTMGINYYDLGYKTGEMAVEVLKGKNPGEMPIEYAASTDEIAINPIVAEEIGYTVPDKYQDALIENAK